MGPGLELKKATRLGPAAGWSPTRKQALTELGYLTTNYHTSPVLHSSAEIRKFSPNSLHAANMKISPPRPPPPRRSRSRDQETKSTQPMNLLGMPSVGMRPGRSLTRSIHRPAWPLGSPRFCLPDRPGNDSGPLCPRPTSISGRRTGADISRQRTSIFARGDDDTPQETESHMHMPAETAVVPPG